MKPSHLVMAQVASWETNSFRDDWIKLQMMNEYL